MFWRKNPTIPYYVCTINKTFAKPGQRMYFQVYYTEENLKDYIDPVDDTLKIRLANGNVHGGCRIMIGTEKRATITTNWSEFRHHANIHEGDICAFHFRRIAKRSLALTVHLL